MIMMLGFAMLTDVYTRVHDHYGEPYVVSVKLNLAQCYYSRNFDVYPF